MQAAVLLGPERIEIQELPVPRPGPGEIVLSVEAATTCGTDVKVYRLGGHPRMLRTPALFGHALAGLVAASCAGVAAIAPVFVLHLPLGRLSRVRSLPASCAGRSNLSVDTI